MKIIKVITNTYLLLVSLVVISILEFGFLAPALVSSQSNLGVSLGFASVVLIIFFYLVVAILLVKKIINWIDRITSDRED